jgi:hypothetical protein
MSKAYRYLKLFAVLMTATHYLLLNVAAMYDVDQSTHVHTWTERVQKESMSKSQKI